MEEIFKKRIEGKGGACDDGVMEMGALQFFLNTGSKTGVFRVQNIVLGTMNHRLGLADSLHQGFINLEILEILEGVMGLVSDFLEELKGGIGPRCDIILSRKDLNHSKHVLGADL